MKPRQKTRTAHRPGSIRLTVPALSARYGVAVHGAQESGPLEALDAPQSDRDRFDERAPDPAETLQDRVTDIAIAGRFDLETGEAVEVRSPAQLERE